MELEMKPVPAEEPTRRWSRLRGTKHLVVEVERQSASSHNCVDASPHSRDNSHERPESSPPSESGSRRHRSEIYEHGQEAISRCRSAPRCHTSHRRFPSWLNSSQPGEWHITGPGFRTGNRMLLGQLSSMIAPPFVTTRPLEPVSPERPKAAQAEPVSLSDGATMTRL